MLLGADISALERIEQGGAVFRQGGQAGDAVAILRAQGSNVFRLRLFVAPNGSEVQVNDLAYTLRMAGRVKAAGARLLLDIHYSDTWADPGHQAIPAAWAGADLDSLEGLVESYTADVVAQLKQAGTTPDIVQVGNEIDAGMLWPLGQVGGAADTPVQWDQLTRLLKAGIRGVQDATDPADSVRIMLHYSQGGSVAGSQWFFEHLDSAGVGYDLIGLSYYPWWHGTLARLRANLKFLAGRYGKDIVVVETSYPWRAGGWEGMVSNPNAMAWPVSPAGQRRFLEDLLDAIATTPENHGAGLLWWYPEAVEVPGFFVFGSGSLALFDTGGNVLPAASVLDAD